MKKWKATIIKTAYSKKFSDVTTKPKKHEQTNTTQTILLGRNIPV